MTASVFFSGRLREYRDKLVEKYTQLKQFPAGPYDIYNLEETSNAAKTGLKFLDMLTQLHHSHDTTCTTLFKEAKQACESFHTEVQATKQRVITQIAPTASSNDDLKKVDLAFAVLGEIQYKLAKPGPLHQRHLDSIHLSQLLFLSGTSTDTLLDTSLRTVVQRGVALADLYTDKSL